MATWNLWHGCHKISPGCQNCYVYRQDGRHQLDSRRVFRTKQFDLPLRRDRQGEYTLTPQDGMVYTCFTSDFFLEEADPWREEAWAIIRQRSDLQFLFITKRIHRFWDCIPSDWHSGYPHVHIGCTVEDQPRADSRLPLFLAAPITHRFVVCEPLLEKIELSSYLSAAIEEVVVGGESGPRARVCDYRWVLQIRDQCQRAGVPFHFKQTGARFRKDDRLYTIPRPWQHKQAAKAGIDYMPQDE